MSEEWSLLIGWPSATAYDSPFATVIGKMIADFLKINFALFSK